MISSIMRTVLMPTARGQRVLVETVSLFQLHYRTVHGIRTTKSEGQALRVSLVKPGAYLSASYHFYVERGLPQTRVLLWVYDEQLRALFDHVVLAEYRCRYDRQTHQVRDIHSGVFYTTPFASPQGLLIPLDPPILRTVLIEE
jgi:hypothetical protein